VVEVDPLVVDVAKRLFFIEESDRLRIHLADARTFIKRSQAQWDLIVVDVTSTNRYGETTPEHLVTREFFVEAAARLAPDGILHYHCPFHLSQLMPALHKTMSSVFPAVIHTPGEILASRSSLIAPAEVLLARLAESPARRLPNLRNQIEGLSSEPIPSDAVPLLTDDYAPADTLLRTLR
jgi:spermidine synthase